MYIVGNVWVPYLLQEKKENIFKTIDFFFFVYKNFKNFVKNKKYSFAKYLAENYLAFRRYLSKIQIVCSRENLIFL